MRQVHSSFEAAVDRFDRCTKFVFSSSTRTAGLRNDSPCLRSAGAAAAERGCPPSCTGESYWRTAQHDVVDRRVVELGTTSRWPMVGSHSAHVLAHARLEQGDLLVDVGDDLANRDGAMALVAVPPMRMLPDQGVSSPSDDEPRDGRLAAPRVTDQGYPVVMPAPGGRGDARSRSSTPGASLATLTADGASLADAEGVTLLPSGDALVSFEREHRVLRTARPTTSARAATVGVEQWVRSCDSVIEGFGNAGIEAVQALNGEPRRRRVRAPAIRGCALHGVRRETPVRVLDVRAPPALARTLHYPIEDGWGVVDFALLAPGTLLVLERTYVHDDLGQRDPPSPPRPRRARRSRRHVAGARALTGAPQRRARRDRQF